MKKVLILLGLGLAINANAGFFSDNDKAYYLKHIDEAKEKIKECKKEMAIARIDKDKEKFEKLLKDKECDSAFKAVKELKRAEWKAEQALREKERKAKEAKDKIEYDKIYKQEYEKFKKMPYKEFAKEGKNIGLGNIFGNKYNPKNAKYDAYKALKETKKKEEIERLIGSYKNEKLLEYKDSICKNAMYGSPNYTKCGIARSAYEEHKNRVVADYFAHQDKLKKDFNECYYKIHKLQKSSKYNEAQKVRNSYKCYMASQAALKLNIYGYFKPIK